MLFKRWLASLWLKALVSSVCNRPLLKLSSEVCSLLMSQQNHQKVIDVHHFRNPLLQALTTK
jgi:hypothetical protein